MVVKYLLWAPLVVGQEQRAEWEQIGKGYYGPEFEITEVCCAV
jgi:hypothetical protein